MGKEKKRHGCLTFLLIVAVVVGGAGFYLWNSVIHHNPNAEALKIINGPADTVASREMTQELTVAAGPGIAAAVVPLPDGSGNGAVIVIDTAKGFKPAAGVDGKRKQAMAAIQKILSVNTADNLNLKKVSLTYQEGGKSIIAVASPIENLEALNAGKLTETDFAAKMGLKVDDLTYFKNLIGN